MAELRRWTQHRTVSIVAAQLGWRAIVQRHSGYGANVNGRYALFRELDRATIEAIPTDQLGGIQHVVAWALMEEWNEEVPRGHEPTGVPTEEAFDFFRFVEPVTTNLGDIETNDRGFVRLVPPDENPDDAEVRRELLEAIFLSQQAFL